MLAEIVPLVVQITVVGEAGVLAQLAQQELLPQVEMAALDPI
jgi:hypothetical protein